MPQYISVEVTSCHHEWKSKVPIYNITRKKMFKQQIHKTEFSFKVFELMKLHTIILSLEENNYISVQLNLRKTKTEQNIHVLLM